MSELRFSIVLPCLTDAATLVRCIDSLIGQTFVPESFEVLVVDDFSQPELAPALDKYQATRGSQLPFVKYIRNERNLGRAKTRNRGISECRGEIILFMDVDQVAEPSLLAALDAAFGEVRLKSVRANSSVWPDLLERSAYLRYYESRFLGKRKDRELDSIDLANLPAKYFASGCIAVTRAALDLAGPFDEEFRFYGCEDEELGTRLEEIGVPLSMCLEAKAFLIADDLNIRRVCKRFVEYAQESVPTLLRKHPAYARQTLMWFLELPPSELSTRHRVARLVAVSFFRPWLAEQIVRLLERRDSRPGFNPSPSLYKLAIAGYYLQGYRRRSRQVLV